MFRIDLQRGLGRVAAFERGQRDGAATGGEGFGIEGGVQDEVLRDHCARRWRPAHGDGGVAGPDALDVGAATRIAVEFDVVEAAVVGELRGLPRRELDAGAIGDTRSSRCSRCGGAGGEGEGSDGGQQAHALFPE